jgi:N-methylhydantoinase A
VDELEAEGISREEITLLPALAMRYVGQSYELAVDLKAGQEGAAQRHVEAFHEAHRQRFSYANQEEPVEIVNLRLKAIGNTPKPHFAQQPMGDVDPRAAHAGYKEVFFADATNPRAARPVPTALYQRDALTAGNIVVGPAIIYQFDTTNVIPPGWAARLDTWGNLVVEARGL